MKSPESSISGLQKLFSAAVCANDDNTSAFAIQSAISLIFETRFLDFSLKSVKILYSSSVVLNLADRTSSSCFLSSSVI